MTTYADTATLLRALTQLHEETIDGPFTNLLFGGAVLIREIGARQRQDANEAAIAQDADRPDQTLYRAMLIQQSVVDPESGQPYADGRTDGAGAPLIDPRTRTPLFRLEDVLLIADGRDVATRELADRIAALSALGPAPLFRGDTTADGSERNARAGDPSLGDATAGDAGEGTGDADGGAPLSGEPVEDAGAVLNGSA
jgi:hypothetical protein